MSESSIPRILLIPDGYIGLVPEVIAQWKYTKQVIIENAGCPTQIELVLDQDGCKQPAPLLYVRLRGGSCDVWFCPSGEYERDDPVLYSSICQHNMLSTHEAFRLFEIIIPLVTMAMMLFKAKIPLPEIAPHQQSAAYRAFSERREKKRQRDDEGEEEGEIVSKDKIARREEVLVK